MSCTVLVSSCDKYRACWEPMAHGLKKYWSDCPYDIKFITNFLEAPFYSIKVDDEYNWTKATKKALKHIDTEFILWLLEDYWITEQVNTNAIKCFVDSMRFGIADHIRLIPSTDIKDESLFDKRLAVFKDDAQYRCSLNAGIWRTKTLLNLLNEDEFIWDFETQASLRSRGNNKFLCVRDFNYIKYVMPDNPDKKWNYHAVDRGNWSESAKLYAQIENLNIDFTKNPKES